MSKSKSRPLWKRLLRRPVLFVIPAIQFVASLIFSSSLYQYARALGLVFSASSLPPIKAALLAHVYYPELWPEIVKVWRTLPKGSPLLITTNYGTGTKIRELSGNNPLIEIYEGENRGRDIAPFMKILNSGGLDRFDAVLKIHTKRSPHRVDGNLRRKVLFASLAGHAYNVRRVLQQFCASRVGLVGPAGFFRSHKDYWMANQTLVETLCRRMRPAAPVRLGFFEGTMFWIRPQALAPLRALNLQPEDFDAEAGQLDGTLHHATERVFTLCALAAGYETRSIAGRILLGAELDEKRA